jgi:hypothetical protein
MSPERRTRLRPQRRAMLIGMGAFGASAVWPWSAGLRADETNIPPQATDRLGTGDATAAVPRAALDEEDSTGPTGPRYWGSVAWRVETAPAVSFATARTLVTTVHAAVKIPERQMSLKWKLWRNDDRTLPASHVIELVFMLPPIFLHGGIQTIAGLGMKQAETKRGTPLKGLTVKVIDNYFLVGLSNVEAEQESNIHALKDWPWIDVPIVYNDGQRAILTFAKGAPGNSVLADAFSAWERPNPPIPPSPAIK